MVQAQGPPSPQLIRLTDLHLSPKTVQITYPASSPPCVAPGDAGSNGEVRGCINYGALERDGATLPTTNDNPQLVGNSFVYDDSGWSYDTHHKYSVPVHSVSYSWATDANGMNGHWNSSVSDYEIFCYVTVRRVLASVNQTADTRLDMRYGDPTLKDYQFKDNIFRGGLFAGYNADNSKVGRTYLKFPSVPGPLVASEQMWPYGGLNVYCTRLANPGSVSLICRTGLSNTWDESTLGWSNAPAPKTTGGPAFTVNWDKTNFFGAITTPPFSQDDATGKWFVINYLPDIQDALATSAPTLTAILMATNETSSYNGAPDSTTGGWAYFAKSGYRDVLKITNPHVIHPPGGGGKGDPPAPDRETNLTAFLLYAFGGEGVSYDTGNGGGGGGPIGDDPSGPLNPGGPTNPGGGATVNKVGSKPQSKPKTAPKNGAGAKP